MKTFLSILAVVATTSCLAAEQSPIASAEVSTNNSPKAIAAAKERGATSAAKDIKAGKFRILYFGKPWSAGKPLMDDATGYRVEIVAGCVVGEEFVAEVEAYNGAMRTWHSKHKPAGQDQKK
jgi:hypothetical protein